MRTLTLTVTGQHITGYPISDMVGNTKNYLECSFNFSSEWSGLTMKIAVFTANSKQYDVLIDGQNKAKVPDVCLAGDYFSVGVIGAADETRITTDTVTYRVEESVRTKPPYDMVNMFEGLEEDIEGLSGDIEDLQAADQTLDARIDTRQPKELDSPVIVDGVTTEYVEESLAAIVLALSGRQTKDLMSEITVDGVEQETTEGAIAACAAALAQRQGKNLTSPITVNGVQQTTTEGALGAINTLLANHIDTVIASANGVHKFRKNPENSDLQYYDTETNAWITISTGGGGGTVVVDDAMSSTSTNPVQNKVQYAAIHSLSETVDGISSDVQRVEGKSDSALQKCFNQLYELCNKTTTITKNDLGQKVITEEDSDTNITAVTTIVQTSSTVKTITTVVTDGEDTYTKTTVVTKTSSGTSIDESYV